jgi:hypothetical protein
LTLGILYILFFKNVCLLLLLLTFNILLHCFKLLLLDQAC